MLISVQTAPILDDFGIDKGFEMIAAAGIEAVDFNIDHCLSYGQIVNGEFNGNGFYDQSDEAMIEFLRPYKEAAARYGVRFIQAHAPFPTYVANEQTNEYVLRAIKKTIMLCGYLDCPNLIVHPCFLSTDSYQPVEDEWDVNIRTYSALIPELRQYGVTCCLENMFSGHRGKITEAICSDPAEAMRYIDALNGIAGEKLFGFCLDVGHATLLGKDVYRFIKVLGDKLQVLHVHDNNGLNDEHLLPYMGVTDWKRFCQGLKEVGYKGPLSFETFNAVATFDKALAPQVLAMLSATAKLFVDRIEGRADIWA